MTENKTEQIPEPALRRLPWYLSYVSLLRERNVEYVSSTQISRELKVDASQIAKDLSFLDIKGKTRIGYEVKLLEHKLEEFLGFRRRHRAVMVGVGSLGGALMQDSGLTRYGLEIVAGFDIDPHLVGSVKHGLPVFHIDTLEDECRRLKAGIGILAVPVEFAQQMADRSRHQSHLEFHALQNLCSRGCGDFKHIDLCASGSDVQPYELNP